MLSGRSRHLNAHHGASGRPPEKRHLDQRVDDVPAGVRVEAPKAGGLRRSQLQARHLIELAAYSIDEGKMFHAG